MGSASPIFGMKIPKIFELPPPRYIYINPSYTIIGHLERVPEPQLGDETYDIQSIQTGFRSASRPQAGLGWQMGNSFLSKKTRNSHWNNLGEWLAHWKIIATMFIYRYVWQTAGVFWEFFATLEWWRNFQVWYGMAKKGNKSWIERKWIIHMYRCKSRMKCLRVYIMRISTNHESARVPVSTMLQSQILNCMIDDHRYRKTVDLRVIAPCMQHTCRQWQYMPSWANIC